MSTTAMCDGFGTDYPGGYSAVGRLQSPSRKVHGLNSRGCFWAVSQAKIEIFGCPRAIGPGLACKCVVKRNSWFPSSSGIETFDWPRAIGQVPHPEPRSGRIEIWTDQIEILD